MILSLVGCGYLEPDEVNEQYILKTFEKKLRSQYGAEFVIKIKSFNKDSERRESVAIAYPKKDPSLMFEISGSIQEDCLDASCFGTSYHTTNNFGNLLLKSVEEKLNNKYKYSLEIGGNADYEKIAGNVLLYLKELKTMLSDYKNGSFFDMYFDDGYLRGYVPLTLNGDVVSKNILIDQDNGKVIIDTSQGDHGWQGELEISDYLEYLATGQLDKKICEIKCNNYPATACKCLDDYSI